MAIEEQWSEKYRPKTLSGYVFKDNRQKETIDFWVKNGSFPHILLSGGAGVGKTTLAKILFNEFNIHELDIMEINASRNNSVEFVRDNITEFIQMIPFGDFKVIFLDEADFLSLSSQAVLRGIMEEYLTIARFVLTCNYSNRIMPAIHSRCQSIHIDKTDINEFTARAATILMNENIDFQLDVLDIYVKATYPDLRKCINTLEMNSLSGKLLLEESTSSSADYKIDMVRLFKSGKIGEARKLVCSQARPEEMEDIYRWAYDNVEMFGDMDKQEEAIKIIKQSLVDHAIICDPEINLADCFIRLSKL